MELGGPGPGCMVNFQCSTDRTINRTILKIIDAPYRAGNNRTSVREHVLTDQLIVRSRTIRPVRLF